MRSRDSFECRYVCCQPIFSCSRGKGSSTVHRHLRLLDLGLLGAESWALPPKVVCFPSLVFLTCKCDQLFLLTARKLQGFSRVPGLEHTFTGFLFMRPAARLFLVVFSLCLPEAVTTKGCCSSTLCHLVSVPCPPLLPSRDLCYLFYSCLLSVGRCYSVAPGCFL